MGSNAILIILCIFFLASTVSAAKFILSAEDQIAPRRGRPMHCPIHFGMIDWGYMRRHCKGPEYPVKICCAAFKRFACPYIDLTEDNRYDCNAGFYANLESQGNFPLGLFSDRCEEGPIGLHCSKLDFIPLPGLPAAPKIRVGRKHMGQRKNIF